MANQDPRGGNRGNHRHRSEQRSDDPHGRAPCRVVVVNLALASHHVHS
jgi:hypothetical protein